MLCSLVNIELIRRLLQNSIDQLVQYTKDWQWQIKFNDKCKILHVGKK